MVNKVLFSRASLFLNLAIALSIALTLVVIMVHNTRAPALIYGGVMGLGVLSFLLAYRILRMEQVYKQKLEEVSAAAHAAAELERRAIALESALDGIAILNADETYAFVNTAHANIYGYSDPKELIGKKWHLLYDPTELTRFREAIMPNLYKLGSARAEATGLRKDGTPFPQEVCLTTIPGGGLVCFVQDLTERKALESQLLQSQKMEALGLLAGGVAHDFNNLLTGVLGSASLIKLTNPEGSRNFISANDIERAALSARDLIQQLLGFARKGKHQQVQINMHEVLTEVISILSRTIESNVEIVTELDAENPFIEGDPVQVQQIILNLAINARDAMDPKIGGSSGGTIRFTTKSFQSTTPVGDVGPGNYFELSVSDTGCGIEDGIRDKIFEPFFTTKQQGKGTGMGLAMVYGIVKNHAGAILLNSKVGSGSTFRVVFPSLKKPSMVVPPVISSIIELPVRGLNILLVDDHEIVREIAKKILIAQGCTVTTAPDGVIALEHFRKDVNLFDLVILDLIMPNMGGKECFQELRRISPRIPVIFVTGYSKDETIKDLLANELVCLVYKPFQGTQLCEAMGALIHRAKGQYSSAA